MSQVAGIKTRKNIKGEITHVTFSIKEHKEVLTPLLSEMGLFAKSDFELRCENAVSVEEARKISINHLRSIWKK